MTPKARGGAPVAVRNGPKALAEPNRPTQIAENGSVMRLLVPMHEVNALLCIAGGCLMPRFEDTAAVDQHAEDGLHLLAWPRSIPRHAWEAARGQLDYGVVVGFEVSAPAGSSETDTGAPIRLRAPIPLSRVHRLVTPSTDASDSFLARAGTYADVPIEAVVVESDAGVFIDASEGGSLRLPLSGPEAKLGVPSADVAKWRQLDKLGGALAGVLLALRAGHWSLEEAARILSVVAAHLAPGPDPVGLGRALVAAMGGADDVLGPAVFAEVANRFRFMSHREGFDPDDLLEEVCATASKGLGPEDASALATFRESGKAILGFTGAEADDWLSDEGRIGLRAVLAMLQASDVAKLTLLVANRPGVGKKVSLLAYLLAGLLRGATALPGSFKEHSTGIHSAMGSLMALATSGTVPSFRQVEGSDHAGAPVNVLMVGDVEVLQSPVPDAGAIDLLSKLAVSEGWRRTKGIGRLEFEATLPSGKTAIRARLLRRNNALPRGLILRLLVRIEGLGKRGTLKREAVARLADVARVGVVSVAFELESGIASVWLYVDLQADDIVSAGVADAVGVLRDAVAAYKRR